ncbi:helicase-exonuclease AddAB subunit AddA [Paenibacillus kandeliae]|uniref:helicase-exonuclease AddAB subunit AddA n=1 Tax=Paenibacillus kandeliae TaxID=3231269 RepID=UPI003F530621
MSNDDLNFNPNNGSYTHEQPDDLFADVDSGTERALALQQVQMPRPDNSTWTEDQWKAISLRGNNLLVAAAAGSGKTAVLVERIIRQVIDPEYPLDVNRMLVATFTKAAATEMRQRIRAALDREVLNRPDDERLRRQLALIGQASITTLHSFCMEVIQRYYAMIPLDPGFRIASENECAMMREELLEELFEEKYTEEEERDNRQFHRLINWFGGERSDDAAMKLVERLYHFARSHPWPEHWLREMAAAFHVEHAAQLEESAWVRQIVSDVQVALDGMEAVLLQAIETAQLPGGPVAYVETLSADLELIHRLQDIAAIQPWTELYVSFQQAAFGKLKPVRKDGLDVRIQDNVKQMRETVKKSLSELSGLFFGRTPDEFAQELREAAPLMEELAEVIIRFSDKYQQEKQRRGWVDFSDLEHYALHILRHPDSTPEHVLPSAAALEYRQRFDEVMLDEYQDTNSVQEQLVRLISRDVPGNRFMVGDVKQSIYRFRLAEPGLFLEKYHQYRDDWNGEGRRIDLSRNFRSRVQVVDAVNMIFRQLMNVKVAEIEYDERAELVAGASYPAGAPESANDYAPEFWLLERGGSDSYASTENGEEEGAAVDDSELEAARLEAQAIIRRVREMTSPDGKPLMIYDKGLDDLRPAEYRDMVILLRSTMIWAPLMIEELQLAGIPAYSDVDQGYFEAVEVDIILSLLEIIDNPQQDIPLASVLRSPLVGLNEDELANVRLAQKQVTFYEALLSLVDTHPNVPDEYATDTNGQSRPMLHTDALHHHDQPAVVADVDDMPAVENEIPSHAVNEDDASLFGSAPADMEVEPSTSNGDPYVYDLSTNVATTSESNERRISQELRQRLQRFYDQLQSWRAEAREGELGDLIWRIYRETGYVDWLGGLPGGVQRQHHLRMLYERARQFERSTSSRGLFRFLRFIRRLKDTGGDLGAVSGGAEENAIRVMTIHKSKGLEFPVVFLAGMSKMFNMQDLNAPFLMHKELGFGPKFVDEDTRVSYPTLPNLAIRRRGMNELLAEELRVLYVALTRPRDKLIMIATVKDLDKKIASWSQIQEYPALELPDYLLSRARSYLDWLGPAFMRHRSATLFRERSEAAAAPYAAVLADDQSDWQLSIIDTRQLLSEVAGEEQEERAIREGDAKWKSLQDQHAPEWQHLLETAWHNEQHRQINSLSDSSADHSDRNAAPFIPDMQLEQQQRELEISIHERLSWQYGYEQAVHIAAKTTVSELKHQLVSEDAPDADLWEGIWNLNPLLHKYIRRAAGQSEPEHSIHDTSNQEYAEHQQDSLPSPTVGLINTNNNEYRGASSVDGMNSVSNHLPSSAAGTVEPNPTLSNQTLHRNRDSNLKLHRPKFMEQKGLTGAERGTAYHTVMQRVPLDHPSGVTADDVEQVKQRLVEDQILRQKEIDSVKTSDITGFFGTALGQRMLQADWIKRELAFSYGLPVNEAGDIMLTQGIIDCLFREGERTILVDYKTDRVLEHQGGTAALEERYRVQLELYAQAVEQSLGWQVDELWLYFFDGQQEVRLKV